MDLNHFFSIVFNILYVYIGVIKKLEMEPKNPVGLRSSTDGILYDFVARKFYYLGFYTT